ncbi:MAG: type IV pilus assembly protein PilP [Halomonadaceae bacterium T82-2]|nr:MAG: type IV pilus assembly protein PilP [Halomonadaceae bacterium T82-2]
MTMWRLLLSGVLLVVLAGCGDARLDALDAKLATLRDRPSGKLPALPDTPAYRPVAYEQADARSPFRPERPDTRSAASGSGDLTPDLSRPKEALERFPLDALTLVGTLSIGDRHVALVRDPAGEVHSLGVGAHLGTDFGRIVAIDAGRVRLVELVSDGGQGWDERWQTLSLGGGDTNHDDTASPRSGAASRGDERIP